MQAEPKRSPWLFASITTMNKSHRKSTPSLQMQVMTCHACVQSLETSLAQVHCSTISAARMGSGMGVTSSLREEAGKICGGDTVEQHATTKKSRGSAEHRVTWVDLKNSVY